MGLWHGMSHFFRMTLSSWNKEYETVTHTSYLHITNNCLFGIRLLAHPKDSGFYT